MSKQRSVNPFEMDIWQDPEALSWDSRKVVEQPFREIVATAYAEYVRPQDTVVEIGSGTGALGRLLNLQTPIVHVDGSRAMLEAHKAQQSSGHDQFAQADLYALPFGDSSVDAVVGLLVLDAMLDTGAAFEEVARVLKPGGRFLYFHDMRASTNGLASIMRANGEIPIPLTETGEGVESFGILKPRDLKRFRRALGRVLGKDATTDLMTMLTDAAPIHFDTWTFDEMDAVEAITPIFLDEFGRKDQTPHVSETFLDILGSMATQLGMEIDELAVRDAEVTRSRNEVANDGYELDSDTNVLLQTIYGTKYGYSNNLPEGRVLVASQPAIFAATKKQ